MSRDFEDRVSKVRMAKSRANFSLGYLNPLSWYKVAREVVALRPDKVILAWIHPVHAPVFFFLLWYISRKSNAELIFICHNILPHENFPGAQWLARETLRKADRLIVHSASEEGHARNLLNKANVNRLFLPLQDFFPHASISLKKKTSVNGAFSLLFFGNIRPYKGLDILLKSLPLVLKHSPDTTLHIAGEVFYNSPRHRKSKLEMERPLQLIQQLNLTKHVTIDSRYIPNEEIAQLFSGADAIVIPYRSATQSAVLSLAYSFGLPAIVTRVGGLAGMIREGETGYVAEPEDPESLAQAIIRFIERPLSRDNLFAANTSLSWANYVQRLLNSGNSSN